MGAREGRRAAASVHRPSSRPGRPEPWGGHFWLTSSPTAEGQHLKATDNTRPPPGESLLLHDEMEQSQPRNPLLAGQPGIQEHNSVGPLSGF